MTNQLEVRIAPRAHVGHLTSICRVRLRLSGPCQIEIITDESSLIEDRDIPLKMDRKVSVYAKHLICDMRLHESFVSNQMAPTPIVGDMTSEASSSDQAWVKTNNISYVRYNPRHLGVEIANPPRVLERTWLHVLSTAAFPRTPRQPRHRVLTLACLLLGAIL